MDTTPAATAASPLALPRPPYMPVIPMALLLAGVLAQFVDVLLAKNVFDIIVNQSEMLSWLVAIGLTLTAAVLMISVGIALRHGGRPHLAAAAVLTVIWIALGLALAHVRMSEGSLLGDEDEPADRVIAGLMLVLYVAAGLDIALHSHAVHDGDRETALSATARVRWFDRIRRPLLARRSRVVATLDRWTQRIDELDATYLDELARIGHHEAELKALARDRLTRGIGDPARSSQVYRRPHEPQAVDAAEPLESERARTAG